MKDVFYCATLGLIALWILLGAQCQKMDPILPTDTDMCPAACERLRELECSEGEDLADGTPCEIFCVETQNNGFPLNPTCVSGLQSCGEIDNCFGR